MGEVLQFYSSPRFRSCTAVCRGCKHEWEAVTESDGLELQCPECLTMKGAFKWAYGTCEGQYAFMCACGCEDFFIMAKAESGHASVYCRNCGDEKKEWWK